ncbi:hypothetical protein QBC41DRAFT_347204 [Cercophora samala]|uniref:Uncharacterized protein n=1 Tax=Cercophora samala TaxID=330535 RepID=A0AA40D9N5_9PEZI|nr:hypothetical protein QBC41DRAFT_347204 [Cercophora samala]
MSKSSLPMPPPPPLLLTKRVTAFLRANLSPSITTAMLTTPAGNLLSHSSPLPASALRRQCAVAASIWAVQSSSSSSSSPFPSSSSSPSSPRRHQSSSSHRKTHHHHHHHPPSLTVQLDSGLVFIIRRLKCGMLFVCMGPGQSPPQQQSLSAAMEPGEARQGEGEREREREREGGPTPIGSPSTSSEVGRASVVSAGTTSNQTVTSQTSTATVSSAGVVMMRRQVEELARWLDERLGGLCIPEEGIGMEGWQQQQHQQHQHHQQQQQQGREQLEIR